MDIFTITMFGVLAALVYTVVLPELKKPSTKVSTKFVRPRSRIYDERFGGEYEVITGQLLGEDKFLIRMSNRVDPPISHVYYSWQLEPNSVFQCLVGNTAARWKYVGDVKKGRADGYKEKYMAERKRRNWYEAAFAKSTADIERQVDKAVERVRTLEKSRAGEAYKRP